MLRRRVSHVAQSLVGVAAASRLVTVSADDIVTPVPGISSASEMLQLLSNGTYVCAPTIRDGDRLFVELEQLITSQYNASNYGALVDQADAKATVLGSLLVKRDFWAYDDYKDTQTYRAVGPQKALFDNYKWSIELADKFVAFAEKWFPAERHTHLRFGEYVLLMKNFRTSLLGWSARPALPKSMLLRPAYGVHVPTSAELRGFAMYSTWLQNFTRPLGIRKALVLHAGCGVTPFQTALNVNAVVTTDPNPASVTAIREDAARLGTVIAGRVRSRVADLFPPLSGDEDAAPGRGLVGKSFNLITYAPSLPIFDPDSGFLDYAYAPSLTGIRGSLEQLFETAPRYLAKRGVIAVLTTNLHSLMEPNQPHPVEFELRANRRYLLLDYFDAPLRGTVVHTQSESSSNVVSGQLTTRGKLRAELWILHALEDLPEFGWVHGVPGAVAPPSAQGNGMVRSRLRMIQRRVAESGQDWGEYRQRLLQMLQDSGGSVTDEDEVAMAVRMKLDPSYGEELALRSKAAIEARLDDERRFHARVAQLDVSPRQLYDQQVAALKPSQGRAASTSTDSLAAAKTEKPRRHKKKVKGAATPVAPDDLTSL